MADGFSSAGYPAANLPESVKARIAAARALQAAAAQSSGPYTSGAVTALKGIEGLMGGLSERAAINEGMAGQAAQRQMMAQLLMSGAPNVAAAATSPATGIPTSAAAAGAASPAPTSSGASALPPGHLPFFASIAPDAQRVAAQTGIDPRIVMAQAALESNYGKSAPGGNLFGIKGAGTGPINTMESVNGVMTPTKASFATFASPSAAFDGYAKLMSGNRYAGVRQGGSLGEQLDALGRSGYATDPNYAAKVGAIARGIDPGIVQTPRGPSTAAPGIAAPIPAGATNRDPGINAPIGDAAVLAARTRLASGQGTAADRATVSTYMQQQNAPQPASGRTAAADMPAPNAQPVASASLPPGITPDMVSFGAPPNAAMAAVLRGQPSSPSAPSPFGAMPAGMAPRPPAGPQPTSVLGGDIQAAPDALSSNGLKMGIMGPNGVDPTIAAQFQSGIQAAALPASGLSTSRTAGFDNLPAGGGVVPSAIGDGGYQGGTRGIQAAINGALPDPGDAAPPPAPAPAAAPLPSAAPPMQTADASLPQTGPMPIQGAQSAAPGQPLGVNPDAPAPNAIPASLNVPASAMAQVLRGPQPMGLPGDGGNDPSSARAFLTQQAQGAQSPSPMAQALRQQPPAQAPQQDGGGFDLGGMLGGLMGGGASQGGGNPLAGLMGGGSGSNPLSGLFGGGGGNPLAGLFGGQQGAGLGGANPFSAAPSASSAPAGSAAFGGQGQGQAFAPGGQGGSAPVPGMGNMNQAQVMALLSNPYTTPQEAELIMNRLAPQPMKLSAGEGLVGRRPDGTYGELYSQAPKAEWTFNAETGRITNAATGEQRQVNAPVEHYETNREGLTTNTRTGQVTPNPGAGYRFMTQSEKQAAGIPLDQPMQVGPNGEMHAATGQTINVGGEQNVYDTGMAKTLLENHQALMQGVDANRTKLRDLNLMSGALQRLQQNGGTTGMGAEEIAHLQSAINTGANTLGLGQQFDVSDKEAIGKVARQISGAAAKDIGGARTTNFDMQQMLEANPGLALSPTGNQRMLGIAQQVTQRNIDVGQAMQDAAAAAVQQGRRVNPVDMEAIRQRYDAQHHIVDPITGQDLSASTKLPEFQQGQAQASAAQSAAPAAPTLQQIQAEIARRRGATGGQ